MSKAYVRLWDEGGYGEDNPLQNTLDYVKAYAKKAMESDKELAVDIANVAIGSVFADMGSGIKFSTTKCPCGCGIDHSGTAVTHEMTRRVDMLVIKAKNVINTVKESFLSHAVRAHTNIEIRILEDAIEGIYEAPSWWSRLIGFLTRDVL